MPENAFMSTESCEGDMADMMKQVEQTIDALVKELAFLHFSPPVEIVYNPLIYARSAHMSYWRSFGCPPKEIMFLGMNPGPWGMVQSGVPFGDVGMVREWLGLCEPVDQPERLHPKRPVQGPACPRAEISGRRLWGWARQRFGTPQAFFRRFWVANYCPLAFMEASGRNRTPDKLPRHEKEPLLNACDLALLRIVAIVRPRIVVGVGRFATQQAQRALARTDVKVGQITHPSPANPRANAGWEALMETELTAMGIEIKPAD